MNWNPSTWNVPEWQAAGRHVLTAGGTIVATLVALHFLTQQQSTDIVQNVNLIWDGAVKVATGIAGLAGVLAPIYAAVRAAHTASPAEQAKSVEHNLATSVGTQASRLDLINAVAKMPEVRAIVAPQVVANATDSPKVVNTMAQAEALPLAAVPRI
jgi:hypothetical protein